jgi:hypothetical protein
MVDLLSNRVMGRTGELTSELPTASENAIESNEQQDGQKSAGEATPPVDVPVSVVPVRAEVRTTEVIGIPQ